jgi:hypothetical protein
MSRNRVNVLLLSVSQLIRRAGLYHREGKLRGPVFSPRPLKVLAVVVTLVQVMVVAAPPVKEIDGAANVYLPRRGAPYCVHPAGVKPLILKIVW